MVSASWATRKQAVSRSGSSRPSGPLASKLHREAGPLGQAVDVGPQGGDEPEVVEQRGPQVERQLADLHDQAVDDLPAFPGQRLPSRGVVRGGTGLKVKLQGRQRLSDLIVQLAGDMSPLIFVSHDQAPRQGGQTPAPRRTCS